METFPVTCHTLEGFYHIDGHTFEKQYKEVLSGFREWDQLEHADEWLLFPENVGPRLAIDESSLSNGELYTFFVSEVRLQAVSGIGETGRPTSVMRRAGSWRNTHWI